MSMSRKENIDVRKQKKQHVGKRKSAKIFRPIDFSHVVTNVMSEQHELIHLNAKKGT